MTEHGNLFHDIPHQIPDEIFQILLQTPGLKIERILSRGQATPPGHWYDQDTHEWVVLLQGRAGLKIAGENHIRELNPGDYVYLPAHLKHRVEWSDTEKDCIWLAIHYEKNE